MVKESFTAFIADEALTRGGDLGSEIHLAAFVPRFLSKVYFLSLRLMLSALGVRFRRVLVRGLGMFVGFGRVPVPDIMVTFAMMLRGGAV